MVLHLYAIIGSRTGGSPEYVSLQPVGVIGAGDSVADEITQQRFDSTGMFHYCCPRPIEDCLIVSQMSYWRMRRTYVV